MRTNWTPLVVDDTQISVLVEKLDISPVLARLLIQRNLANPATAKRFLQPDLQHLHDPFLMNDMDVAVERLRRAIQEEQKILLYGDYDVDGTTAVALMDVFLRDCGAKPIHYLPDRYNEGYGISMESIEKAREKKVDLIIALDCGVKGHEPIRQAKSYGIDTIVCDHHLPDPTFPEAIALLDPQRPDDTYPYKFLSGCGIAYKLVQAYYQRYGGGEKMLIDLLDLVVLSIASDIVPLTGENRILAHFGLRQINTIPRPGIQSMLRRSGRDYPLSISDLVFGVGPMINAAGRMADAQLAVDVMIAEELSDAETQADFLERRNKLRRRHDREMYQSARQQLEAKSNWEQHPAIVLFDPNWHQGIVGIVASRMADRYQRPTIILTEKEGLLTGSARSAGGFNLYAALEQCSDLLTGFGGHRQAAGLKIEKAKLPEFVQRFLAQVGGGDQAQASSETRIISAELSLDDITDQLWKELRQLAPFGPGNLNPLFVSRGVQDSGYSKVIKNDHLRISVVQEGTQRVNGIAFGRGADLILLQEGKADICYTIEANHWQGRREIRINVKEIIQNGSDI